MKPRWPRRCAPGAWAARPSTCSSPSRLKQGSAWEGCPNIILTPHVAGVTAESNVRVSTLIAAEVARALQQ